MKPLVYAEVDDLQRPALGLPHRALEGFSASDIEAGLEATSRFADGYIARTYTMPLKEYSDDLRLCVCVITAYNLMCGRGFNPEGGDEQLRLRYEDMLRWLRDIAAGKVRPPGFVDSSTSPDPGGNGSAGASVESQPPRGW
jgi:phage gp36-like protein